MGEALEEVNNTELPFLKCIEVLPLKEAVSNIASSEMAADAVQKAVSEARTYVASRTLESRRFTEAISKSTIAAFRKLTNRINVSVAKLSAFRRDTESRRRAASMQEASKKVASAKAALRLPEKTWAHFLRRRPLRSARSWLSLRGPHSQGWRTQRASSQNDRRT